MQKISQKEARLLALQHQGLRSNSLNGKEGALAAFEKIRYVQIDTLSVVQRAHHHVLWSRVRNYKQEHLWDLVRERAVFEYWAHAASYLPMRDYRFTLPRQERFRSGKGLWHKKNPRLMKYALDRIKAEGPLMSRDFDKDKVRLYYGNQEGWSTTPISQTLFQLFMEGELMIVGRKGFQKVFDMTERVLPSEVDDRTPSRDEYIRHLIERDISAHGLVKANEIGYLVKNTTKDINRLLAQMVEAEELVEVTIHGLPQTYYTFPNSLEQLPIVNRERRIRILSPFDNLIIQRKRLEELFGFSYTLECYVTKTKRKVGYFSLPLLRGSEFVGQADLKADRKTKVLWIKNLVWEEGKAKQDHLWKTLSKSLQGFAKFNSCEVIESEVEIPDWVGRL